MVRVECRYVNGEFGEARAELARGARSSQARAPQRRLRGPPGFPRRAIPPFAWGAHQPAAGEAAQLAAQLADLPELPVDLQVDPSKTATRNSLEDLAQGKLRTAQAARKELACSHSRTEH